MKKYFIVSDTHSFFKEMMASLRDAGFDIDNPNHIFILCGDLFDRGKESKEIYEFVKSIPKERRILIRGNHEYLLRDLVDKNYPDSHDFSNGTVKTVCDLVDELEIFVKYKGLFELENRNMTSYDYWGQIVDKFMKLDLIEWIFSDEWVNYYELGNLILVHSFIPLNDANPMIPAYYLYGHEYSYKEDWRTNSHELNWEDSTWGCPWMLYKEGLFDEEAKKGKILVCGHWHTSDFHKELGNEEGENFGIYVGDNLIALDGCTAYTHLCNVLVVEEQETGYQLYDKLGNELRFLKF